MKFLALLLALLVSAQAAPLHLSKKAVSAAVQQVVEAQLTALRAQDYAAAYALASVRLQRQFTASLFARLIKRGYPALAHHARSEAGFVYDDGQGRAEVIISVYDGQDRQSDYRYLMVKQSDQWRINGVLAEAPPKRGDT